MKKFFSNYCNFKIVTCCTAKTLMVAVGITLATSIFLPITINRAISQESPQELTKPTAKTPNPILLQNLLGTWQVQPSMEPENLTFIFAPDGKLFLYSSEQKKGTELGYKIIDTSTTPIQIDIYLKDEGVVKTIVELTPDGKLKMQIQDTEPGNQRPLKFADNVTVFDKVSEAISLPEGVELVENNSAKASSESQGKLYTGSMVRAQQAYFLEYGQFANKIADLGIGQPGGEYDYSLSGVKPRSRSVMIVSKAKQPNDTSYIGLVYVVGNGNEMRTMGGVCQTQQVISQIPNIPSAPQTDSAAITCPTGFDLVK